MAIVEPMKKSVVLPSLFLALVACTRTIGAREGTDTTSVVVRFEVPSSSTRESNSSHAVHLRLIADQGPLESALTVSVIDSSGTLVAGADYRLRSWNVTFPIGSVDGQRRAITVEVLDDSLLEGPEHVLLALHGPSLGRVSRDAPLTHEVTIMDDERVSIAFDMPASMADERGGAHDVWLRLVADGATTAVPISAVVVDSRSGSAVSDRDYVAFGTQTVTFEAGSTDGAVERVVLELQADVLEESEEVVDLSIDEVCGPGASIGNPSNHIVSIVNDLVRGFGR
ncbi:MAG: hypothetical protein JSW67_15375 [Candidatus Latescibacterota bacterium]|nr:MAG: hypothetical protein JSW67_15375 [Candidatus Latescibacterota bacterium]